MLPERPDAAAPGNPLRAAALTSTERDATLAP
jgi:hypothetical protein